MPRSEGDTHSAFPPMGQFCENRHKTTDEDLAWLSNPANEPTVVVEDQSLTWHDCDVTLYPFGAPVPADVNQHGIGDCSALAVLGSMAYLYPEFIRSIITDNGNRTYTVKMFDPQGKRINVTVSSQFLCNTDMNCGAVTSKHDVVCWSTVLEKAIMKWNSWFEASIYVPTDRSKWPLQLWVKQLTSEGMEFLKSQNPDYNRYLIQYAAIIISTAPILIALPFFIGKLEKGMVLGGVKG